MAKLIRPLVLHPSITCLDVGDCDLGEKGLKSVCELLPPDGTNPGISFFQIISSFADYASNIEDGFLSLNEL